jgi:choline dehydrogenase-like flavoprotein
MLFKKLSLDANNVAIRDYYGIGVALSLRTVSLSDQLNVQYEFRQLMPKSYFFWRMKNSGNYSKVSALINALLTLERVVKYMFRKCKRIFDILFRHDKYSIYIKSEEVPFVNSTTYLDVNSCDQLVYSHKVKNETFELLQENINKFQRSFNNFFDAKLKLYGEIQNINLIQNFFGPNWHPMGTAKIGLESANSICNSNLQVHGIENLYLLSGAVFPTGSNANPTFTVLALANRLIESSVFQFSSVQDS